MTESKESNAANNGSVPPLLLDDEDGVSINNNSGNTLYKYRDFSTMPEEPDNEDESANSRSNLESSIRVQKFPVKLYAILAQKEFHDIITFMPHGRSWKVLKPNLFESMVMPLFFEYSNYHSFNRLVNAWSFRRISSGPDRGSYYHELFLRGKPHLQKYMRRLPKTHKKLPMKKEDEPDFYKLDKEHPLPPLDEIPLSQAKMQNNVNAAANMGLGRPQAALSMSPMRNGPGGFPPRMFGGGPDGVNSQGDVYGNCGGEDGGYNGMGMAGRASQNRSPSSVGMSGMREPSNFKSMEFKPVDGGYGPSGGMGSSGMMGHGNMMSMQSNMNNMMMNQGMGMMNSPMSSAGGYNMHQMGGGPGFGGNMMMQNPSMSGPSSMMNPMPGMGSMNGGGSSQFHNLQRLRQMQQMQLFERQQMNGGPAMPVGGSSGFSGGEDGTYSRVGSYMPHC